ncbi:hypothetical protein ACSSS7_001152 [Eimeria intestinalis]
MEQLALVNSLQPTTPVKAPLKSAKPPLQTPAEPWKPIAATLKPSDANAWGFIGHPAGGGATASTASGPSTTSGSSTFSGISVSGSFSMLKSLETVDQYTTVSHSGTPTLSKRQYVAVLPAKPSACNSLRIPANAVATSDMSPAWCQYQTTSVGSPLNPVYCSLTPATTAGQPPRIPGKNTGRLIQQALVEGTSADKGGLKACEKNQSSVAGGVPASQQDSLNGSHRKSSLLLNETPLQVASLPQVVQALIHAGSAQPHETPKQFPEWFDAEAGCIRRECLPALPTFRINLNTSVAKLSVASRAHHRTRLPGESAKVAVTGCHQAREKTLRRLSCPDASLLRGRPDSAPNLLEPPAQATPSSCGGKQSPMLSPVTEGLAARSRRVRFATVASAREYKERSPSLMSGSPAVSNPLSRTISLTTPHVEDSEATDSPQLLRGQRGAQARALEMAQRMTGMIERLLSTPALKENEQSTEELQSGLKLLQAFTAECAGRLPALSFFADTLEKCQELVEHKLPEQERKPLLELIESSKVPLLSRDAVIRLHRIRQEMRHPEDLDLLLIPLDVLQHSTARNVSCNFGGVKLRTSAVTQEKLMPLRPLVDQGAGRNARNMRSNSLSFIVDAALQKTQEYGACSLALLSLDSAGEKLRFATSGFLRLLVLRRSNASGVLCRVAESPVRNAAAAAEAQLFRWPSKEELLEKLYQHQQEEAASEISNIKADLDAGTRRQALMRVVEWAEAGDGRNSRGLVEQELAVQEGDFFLIADEIVFDVISSEEIRYLFSCCLTSIERYQQRHQRFVSQVLGRRSVAEVAEACPLDLTIAAGWFHAKPGKAEANAPPESH